MCLGVPMKIVSLHGERAFAEALGVRREIALSLLPQPWPHPGDYVMVHVGYAIERVDATLAEESHTLWQAMEAGRDA
ncbi:HypC/HybG/HupF family hydrogenase formation chaperone [Uliginosibacterium aquaticum]|uniref:HypC/HybG/HupF family hydrogenase formation chaperone n=1 Tax=Uliginosibacterium aquaticum TaxID=2731212 RepID=A0ABX2IK69_9RHOO|nr:HypC/HybG/HupF family hydrogenase formation chaperone [Uliginosibacterium aquaticum]NSL56707.1 HypC/HybG/HupF family hydrogenase formation chaperone [Uliginosibacterium aquaticum]